MFAPLVLGLSLFGFGEGLLVASQWGATPWTVFAEGLSRHSGLSLGWSTAIVSAIVLLLWIPLRERPGLGTLTNLVIIAYVLDISSATLPTPHAAWLRLIYIASGVLVIGLGSALYLTTGLGPGPRDGLMTSLHRRLGLSVVYVRLTLEVVVLVIGILLGGDFGLGTLVFAGGIGFAIGMWLKVVDVISRRMGGDLASQSGDESSTEGLTR